MQIFQEFKKLYCEPRNLSITNYIQNSESAEYSACQFDMNFDHVHFRSAKITPTKTGQFVTFWKRDHSGVTVPYDINDRFDSLIVYTKTVTQQGFFLFPKEALLHHDIVSKDNKGGKRGFRVYPAWDKAENAQAKKAQAWQLRYFMQLPYC